MSPLYFSFGETEKLHLQARDPVLGRVIKSITPPPRPVIPELFPALMQTILSQQISAQAADTVWNRFLTQCAPVTPEHIAVLSPAAIQACGTTFRKAGCLQTIAKEIISGKVSLGQIPALSDEQICRMLSQLPGIGVWTAEMLLIHCLQRPDVISYGDLAILRGMRMLYRHRQITPQLFAKYRRRYAPFATTASIYLWAISAGAIPELTDPAAPRRRKTSE